MQLFADLEKYIKKLKRGVLSYAYFVDDDILFLKIAELFGYKQIGSFEAIFIHRWYPRKDDSHASLLHSIPNEAMIDTLQQLRTRTMPCGISKRRSDRTITMSGAMNRAK